MRRLSNIALTILVLIVLLLANNRHTAYQPRVVPPPTPMAYTMYLPTIGKPPGLYGAGVASTAGGRYDALLGAAWHYVWGWCDAPCIPMTRDWAVPRACPQFLLVGNEPNAQEPYGHPIEPEQAALASWAIRAACPGAWLIVGNLALPEFLGMTGIEWWTRYVASGGAYDQIGIHTYTSPNGNARQAIKAVEDFIAAFPGEQYCVTELGTFNRKPAIFAELVDWVATHLDCWAGFTDYDDAPFYAPAMNMVESDGTLNEYGAAFRERAQGWMK